MICPEHEKMKKIALQSQVCGRFIAFIEYRGFHIRSSRKGKYFRLTDMLAEFFEIDQEKLEEEKRAMLGGGKTL